MPESSLTLQKKEKGEWKKKENILIYLSNTKKTQLSLSVLYQISWSSNSLHALRKSRDLKREIWCQKYAYDLSIQ